MTVEPAGLIKRVALLRPPTCMVLGSFTIYGAVPPLGLAYLASAVRLAGHRVQVIDAVGEALDRYTPVKSSSVSGLYLNGLTADDVLERIEPDTQVLGISNMFLFDWPFTKKLAEMFRARFPNAVVVVGGENATSCWRQYFQETSAIDYCVLGEGEATFLEMLKWMPQHPIGDIAGVASRRHMASAHLPTLPTRYRDLDALPRPAWDLFPVERYLERASDYGVNRGRSMPVLASRGCPYQCTFCPSPQMWTTRYYLRNPRDVVDEIEDHVRRYCIDNIDFADLTAIVQRDWILEFCRILEERKLGISWQLPVGTRSEALDEEVLRGLQASGCRNLSYAPESASRRMLRIMKKKLDPDRVMASMTTAAKLGLVVRFHILIGHPDERLSDLWESAKFIVRAAIRGIRDAGVFVFVPMPGSEDRQRLVDAGVISNWVEDPYLGVAFNGRRVSVSCHPRWSRQQLFAMQIGLLMVFYTVSYAFHPQRILLRIRGLIHLLVTRREEDQMDKLIGLRLRQLLAIFRYRWLARTSRPRS